MDSLTATAASGMRARVEVLDVLANNIANAATSGYKADQESYNLYFGDNAWDGFREGHPPSTEMPVVEKNWTDYSQGTLLPTSSPSDLALASGGFFTVSTPNGPLWTRNGHFSVKSTGELQTQEGYQVQGVDGKPIKIDATKDFRVAPTGEVMQEGAIVGRLAVVNTSDKSSGEKIGAGYFRFTPDTKWQPMADADVVQGKLETSNVTPSTAAIKLVGVMRSFEMLQRAVTMASEMNKRVVEEVARVTS